ncbi:unnamed protein product [Amoebophrya sp. A120]|nr:unnamed protein product [Amoebophrya sp. A120]|eukprot:GSA120T00003382001.1
MRKTLLTKAGWEIDAEKGKKVQRQTALLLSLAEGRLFLQDATGEVAAKKASGDGVVKILVKLLSKRPLPGDYFHCDQEKPTLDEISAAIGNLSNHADDLDWDMSGKTAPTRDDVYCACIRLCGEARAQTLFRIMETEYILAGHEGATYPFCRSAAAAFRGRQRQVQKKRVQAGAGQATSSNIKDDGAKLESVAFAGGPQHNRGATCSTDLQQNRVTICSTRIKKLLAFFDVVNAGGIDPVPSYFGPGYRKYWHTKFDKFCKSGIYGENPKRDLKPVKDFLGDKFSEMLNYREMDSSRKLTGQGQFSVCLEEFSRFLDDRYAAMLSSTAPSSGLEPALSQKIQLESLSFVNYAKVEGHFRAVDTKSSGTACGSKNESRGNGSRGSGTVQERGSQSVHRQMEVQKQQRRTRSPHLCGEEAEGGADAVRGLAWEAARACSPQAKRLKLGQKQTVTQEATPASAPGRASQNLSLHAGGGFLRKHTSEPKMSLGPRERFPFPGAKLEDLCVTVAGLNAGAKLPTELEKLATQSILIRGRPTTLREMWEQGEFGKKSGSSSSSSSKNNAAGPEAGQGSDAAPQKKDEENPHLTEIRRLLLDFGVLQKTTANNAWRKVENEVVPGPTSDFCKLVLLLSAPVDAEGCRSRTASEFARLLVAAGRQVSIEKRTPKELWSVAKRVALGGKSASDGDSSSLKLSEWESVIRTLEEFPCLAVSDFLLRDSEKEGGRVRINLKRFEEKCKQIFDSGKNVWSRFQLWRRIDTGRTAEQQYTHSALWGWLLALGVVSKTTRKLVRISKANKLGIAAGHLHCVRLLDRGLVTTGIPKLLQSVPPLSDALRCREVLEETRRQIMESNRRQRGVDERIERILCAVNMLGEMLVGFTAGDPPILETAPGDAGSSKVLKVAEGSPPPALSAADGDRKKTLQKAIGFLRDTFTAKNKKGENSVKGKDLRQTRAGESKVMTQSITFGATRDYCHGCTLTKDTAKMKAASGRPVCVLVNEFFCRLLDEIQTVRLKGQQEASAQPNSNQKFSYSSVNVYKNAFTYPHRDSGNIGDSCVIAMGDFVGGGLFVHDPALKLSDVKHRADLAPVHEPEDGRVVRLLVPKSIVESPAEKTRMYGKEERWPKFYGSAPCGGKYIIGREFCVENTPRRFDAREHIHGTMPFEGERFCLIFFTHSALPGLRTRKNQGANALAAFLIALEDLGFPVPPAHAPYWEGWDVVELSSSDEEGGL